jgi:hypothetical protein
MTVFPTHASLLSLEKDEIGCFYNFNLQILNATKGETRKRHLQIHGFENNAIVKQGAFFRS